MNNLKLGWFATLPGIMITLGVIFLIVALVLLIVSRKKDKKVVEQAPAPAADANAQAPVAAPNMAVQTPVAQIGRAHV